MRAPSGDRERILDRAKRYPYEAPRTSFVLAGGRTYEMVLEPSAGGGPALDGAHARDPETGRPLALEQLPAAGLDPSSLVKRTPVLAYGANRTPEALERKRRAPVFPSDEAIVVLRARLHHLDVVFSAHVSLYGSIGATLASSPGTTAEVCVTLLTEEQLAAIGATELNYMLEELSGIDLELEGGARLERVRAYVSRHGALLADDCEVALAAIPAHRRRLSERTETEMLATVAARLGHDGPLDDFILESAGDPEVAAARTRELRRGARPLDWPLASAPAAAGRPSAL